MVHPPRQRLQQGDDQSRRCQHRGRECACLVRDQGNGGPEEQRHQHAAEQRWRHHNRKIHRACAAEPRFGQRDDRRERQVGEARPVHVHAGGRVEPPLHHVVPRLSVDPVKDLHHAHEVVRTRQQPGGPALPAEAEGQQNRKRQHRGQRVRQCTSQETEKTRPCMRGFDGGGDGLATGVRCHLLIHVGVGDAVRHPRLAGPVTCGFTKPGERQGHRATRAAETAGPAGRDSAGA